MVGKKLTDAEIAALKREIAIRRFELYRTQGLMAPLYAEPDSKPDGPRSEKL